MNDAINHFAALNQVEQWVAGCQGVTAVRLLTLHLMVMGRAEGLRDNSAGALRTSENAAHVAEKLTELMEWRHPDYLHPLLFAAARLGQFEALRPFLDAGGRTGRLLLNWQLLQAGFPLALIQAEERARYLAALDAAHGGNILDLQTFVASAVECSLDLAADGK